MRSSRRARSPTASPCSLLEEVTAGDSRVVCTGTTVSLVGGRPDPLLEEAELVVFDLETTGLAAGRDQICEIGAVRVKGLELVDSFQSLVNPRIALPEPIARLTGLREQELRGAPSVSTVVRRFLAFAGDELLVAHNARFDQRFLERQLGDRRLSEPPLCTAALARRLLEGRLRRVGLASLADFFGVPTQPVPPRAARRRGDGPGAGAPDRAGAGARCEDAVGAARPRRAPQAQSAREASPGPRRADPAGRLPVPRRHDHVLYVGRARDLRARLRSYFRSDSQRPSVEAALLALARIEWRVLGSELEAALEELRLIRELEPPANSRGRRKEQGVYLRRRGDEFVVSKKAGPLGPIGSRRQAALAARALASCTDTELETLLQGGPLPRLRARLDHLSESQRYEEAARLRDRVDALEKVVERLYRLDRLRRLELCLIAPALEPGWQKAFFVSGGAVRAVRSLPPGAERGSRSKPASRSTAPPASRTTR